MLVFNVFIMIFKTKCKRSEIFFLQVQLYKKKKKMKFFNALMGKIKNASNNRANMNMAKEILLKKLNS